MVRVFLINFDLIEIEIFSGFRSKISGKDWVHGEKVGSSTLVNETVHFDQ